METLSVNTNQERKRDPFLEILWDEYEFPGQPPFENSNAEQRLKAICIKYSKFLEDNGTSSPRQNVLRRKFESDDTERRTLHNQLAIMVVGKQRSGMDSRLAENIAEFAFEYTKGYKLSEIDKYRNQNGGVN